MSSPRVSSIIDVKSSSDIHSRTSCIRLSSKNATLACWSGALSDGATLVSTPGGPPAPPGCDVSQARRRHRRQPDRRSSSFRCSHRRFSPRHKHRAQVQDGKTRADPWGRSLRRFLTSGYQPGTAPPGNGGHPKRRTGYLRGMASDLVPVFVPPLAMVLGAAEREKAQPLTETEVLAIRDRSGAVMAPPEVAEKMTASRGYRDVEPEDCWADWHRLRVEYSGLGYLPKFVLCVLGDAAFAKTAGALLGAESVEHEVRGRDERMGTAFRAAAFRSDPSLTKKDLAAIDRHQSAVYFLSKNFGAGAALSTARRMLALGARLLDAGGTAMKCDSSGIAHGRARWRALAKRGDDESLFHAFVQYPIGPVRNDYYTCGLHLLGTPDLVASKAALAGKPPRPARCSRRSRSTC